METPLDRSTTWAYEDGEPGAFHYARSAHPNGVAAERALGELEGGDAVLFASGTAATTAVALALLQPGQTIALAEDAYYGTGVTFAELGRWGLNHVVFDQTGPPPPDADLVWIESPSNPLLTVPDFEAAVAHPASVLCDATASTPVHLRSLERGCDFALHSATKYLAGHHDALLGAVVCRRPEDAERLRAFRNATGAIAGPDAAWILLRGLRTLEVRVLRQTESAHALAERLAAHSAVTTVRYPGFGGLLSFDVADGEAARLVETGTKLIVNATSLGGVTSTIETRFRWEGTRVPPGLLRLSVGVEQVEELWVDLEQALARI
jgi:cystathionine gamma-synthase